MRRPPAVEQSAFFARLLTIVPGVLPDEILPALIHTSFKNECGGDDNQRLEFLGDAVLGLCACELLQERYPRASEGELSRMRAAVVNANALAEWGRSVALPEVLRVGRGAEAERTQTNVVADAVEAVIAVVYRRFGLETARSLVSVVIGQVSQAAIDLSARDPKGELQERLQALSGSPPTYRLVERTGPPHDPTTIVECIYAGAVVGKGEGRSRKLAERAAAGDALRTFEQWSPQANP